MRVVHGVTGALSALLLLGSLGGQPASMADDVAAPAPEAEVATPTDAPTESAPAATPDVPSTPRTATAVRQPLPSAVALQRPDLRIDGANLATGALVEAIDGVRAVVPAATLAVSVHTPEGMHELEALVVDPVEFRPFTPDVTALEPAVWERMLDGEAVFTQASAHAVDAVLGEPTTLSGPHASEAVRIGALAANGLPQVADLLLPWELGRRLGAGQPDTVFVAVDEGIGLEGLRDVVAEATDAEVSVLEEPVQQQEVLASVGRTSLEAFTYQDVGDGSIRIDPSWVARHIASAPVPVLGTVRCHRVMLPQLHAALAEVEAAGLGHLVSDYGGCYVPRHILWDDSRGISRHAWGLAIDFNVQANLYGAVPTMDMRIVQIFKRWGFEWGGDWSTPDGMHFELAQIVQ